MSHRRLLITFSLAAAFAAHACSLTEGDYEPDAVDVRGASPIGNPPASSGTQTPTDQKPECSSDSDCPAGAACVESTCRRFACEGAEGAVGCEITPPGLDTCQADADCETRVCEDGVCLPPTCSDGRRNGTEADTDCGPGCPNTCAAAASCTQDSDCAADLYCAEPPGRCTIASCQDGTLNGNELATDCGGGDCPGCEAGSACNAAADCASSVCAANGVCSAASCNDGVENQDETGTDCGGGCPANCATGAGCSTGADCTSGVCANRGCAADRPLCCQAPTCSDNVTNGGEPVTDCGNAACGACPVNHACTANGQCQTGLCQANVCRQRPPCTDGTRNNAETDVDCGGSDAQCARCALGRLCTANGDCASNSCINQRCAACGDGARNGNETDVDCGGSCGPCNTGLICNQDSDCADARPSDPLIAGVCEDGRCCGGNQLDCTRCALRLVVDLDCSFATDAPGIANCNNFLGCLSANPQACPTRHTGGCSDAGAICDHNLFGGNGGTGLVQADHILGTAACFF